MNKIIIIFLMIMLITVSGCDWALDDVGTIYGRCLVKHPSQNEYCKCKAKCTFDGPVWGNCNNICNDKYDFTK